jgi:signal transduction histidine kinase/HAMP domain-containing protein
MKLRTRAKIASVFVTCIFLAYAAMTIYLNHTVTHFARQANLADEIIVKIDLLRFLTVDNLIYRTERAEKQWAAVYDDLRQLLNRQDYQALLREHGLADTADKLKILGDFFKRSLALQGAAGANNPAAEVSGEFQSQLTNQLLLTAMNLSTRFTSLGHEIDKKLLKVQRWTTFWNILALLALAAIIISANRIFQRAVVNPVLKLREGVAKIGAGNLDYQVRMDSRDEIAELSQTFDEMTANLKNLTVSRDELVKEMEERRRMEEETKRLASFPQLNPSPILEIDASGAITFYNQAAVEVLEKIGPEARLADLLPADLGEIAAAARQDKEKVFYREVRVKDTVFGQNIYFVAPFDVLRIYSIDITERKQAEEALKERTGQLERSNRDLEDFAYVSSHDLQEPLRQMANFSEILAQEYGKHLDERGVRYSGYITAGAKRLLDLINDLLAYSRVSQAEIPQVPASLEDILQGTLKDLHTLIMESSAEISHDPLPTLRVNPNQMAQLLQNLITNALKFRNEQPTRIHLSVKQEGGEWVISIRDNGIGFDQKYAEQIFQVFKRMHSQEKYPGTGIGLAICKKIVERHGGRIWAESQPGQGATFYFTIPA